MEPLDVARLLALAGLLIGTAAYSLLMRRRQRGREDAKERQRLESNSRAMARFRHLDAPDED